MILWRDNFDHSSCLRPQTHNSVDSVNRANRQTTISFYGNTYHFLKVKGAQAIDLYSGMDFLSPWGNPTENRPRITVGVLVGP